MDKKTILTIAAVAVFGVINHFFLTWIWGYIATSPLLQNWILGLAGQSGFHKVLLYAQDLIINLVLSIPIAALIFSLKPRKLILYSSIALLPTLLISSFVGSASIAAVSLTIIKDWSLLLLPVPITVFLLHKIITRAKA